MSNKESKTIVFIHGFFVNNLSWNSWVKFYQDKGYTCHAPAYPFHEGNPSELRNQKNAKLGKLTFKEVVRYFTQFIDILPEKPMLIGHSIGGLIVQKLIEKDKGYAGISIHPAAPSLLLTYKWCFYKANLPVINSFKGNSTFLPSEQWFQNTFCNTMSIEETKIEYNKYVVSESRNIPRNTTLGSCIINYRKAYNPLLILAGEKDNILPASLNKLNYKLYKNKNSRTDFKVFAGRSHYVCGQQNWEEVATYINDWIVSLSK